MRLDYGAEVWWAPVFSSVYSRTNLGRDLPLLEMSIAACRCDFESTFPYGIFYISSNEPIHGDISLGSVSHSGILPASDVIAFN